MLNEVDEHRAKDPNPNPALSYDNERDIERTLTSSVNIALGNCRERNGPAQRFLRVPSRFWATQQWATQQQLLLHN